MTMERNVGRYGHFVAWGRSGTMEDVDRLMQALVEQGDLVTSKLVDYALGQVTNREGVGRIKQYLFDGVLCQRNFAALYFRRKGWDDLLDAAVAEGCIDWEQAYAK